MRLKVIMVAAIALSAACGAVNAQELVGTLLKIKSTGRITIGHRESSIPFSYFGSGGKVVGYAMDLCYLISDVIRAKLSLPKLDIELMPVTASSRIPLILSEKIDLECGSTSNNLERQKVVAFSVTNFVTANRFVAKAAANLKTLADLRGKTVVSTIATTNLKQIRDLDGQRHLGLTVIAAKDHSEAFRMLESDRAAAFVMDDILLYSLVANSAVPADYALSTESLSVEPYGIMLRRDDAPLKQLVDDTIVAIYRSGEIHKIYAKWFLSPIPPKGIILNVPMSASLQQIIERPIDSGDPAAYLGQKIGDQ